jgi:menaquinone-dependent protoporphyrinogen IX oxidase
MLNTIKSLIIYFSFHHNNTEKIANVFANVHDAQIKTPQQIITKELQDYDLIGFGSGIYDEKHHKILLDLVDKLLQVTNKRALLGVRPTSKKTPSTNKSNLSPPSTDSNLTPVSFSFPRNEFTTTDL